MPRRRTYRHPARTSYRSSPVTVRSLSSPSAGWSLEDGVDLVLQGYTPEHVEKVTGWAASVLAAQVRLGERARGMGTPRNPWFAAGRLAD